MKRRKASSPIFQGRRFLLMLVLLALIGVLLLRAAWLEVYQGDWLQEQADKRQTSIVKIPASRGMIVDRNGDPLAISSPVESLWCNPSKLIEARAQLRKEYEQALQIADSRKGTLEEEKTKALELAGTRFQRLEKALAKVENELELAPGELLKRLNDAKDKRFFYLGRLLSPELAEEFLDLNIDGVGSTQEYRRFYPMTETSSQLVGMTDVDGKGIEGIEKAKNDILAGKNGRKRVVLDGKRRSVEDVDRIEDMVPGQTVQLSIDRRIQYLAYRALLAQVTLLRAKAGSVVVMDAHTGEVLAMTNYPAFNPNNRKEVESAALRNRAVTDKFEPGSTLKPLTVAAALESGVIRPDIEVDTSPGYLNFGKYKVKDPINYGVLSIAQILAKSSNVGASRLALLMNPRDHWMFLNRVGLGRITESGLVGETEGTLSNYVDWGQVDRASHGYGYGLSTSLLQLTHAYTPFAAQGMLYPVSVYKLNTPPSNGQQVISPETAKAVLHMMEAVVQTGGTGQRGEVDGYRIAGKTGTAYKYINGKYRNDKFMTSFIGIAPASNPRLVVAVQIDEPKINDSGGRAAAPVFAKIMAESLRLLDIAPDSLPDLKQAERTRSKGATAGGT
ncbi:peptidoglycan D,D-transpeptidase FtsI family protein [Thiofilum flexile]|uniref:peptidoglycan D,D-transpeptidase FtsI family protein n=1 Tax=Thiofilum flexile TaxID=125627 RepID=UPI000366E652|nr:penicillin-binding protein 2 [Thiofilum flexile]